MKRPFISVNIVSESKKEPKSVEGDVQSPTTKAVQETVFHLPFGATPLPPELQKRKGRYWNYEKNRWSFCSDDSDDDDGGKEKHTEKVKEEEEKREQKEKIDKGNKDREIMNFKDETSANQIMKQNESNLQEMR